METKNREEILVRLISLRVLLSKSYELASTYESYADLASESLSKKNELIDLINGYKQGRITTLTDSEGKVIMERPLSPTAAKTYAKEHFKTSPAWILCYPIGIVIMIINKIRRKKYIKECAENMVIFEAEAKKKVTELESSLESFQNTAQAFIKSVKEDNANGRSVAYWKLAVQYYSDILHPVDFGSLDYILYLFITGRCDDMKEALHILDEEKRSARIVNAIGEAARYLADRICDAINALGDRLETALKSYDIALDDAVSTINRNIRISSDRVVDKIKAVERTVNDF